MSKKDSVHAGTDDQDNTSVSCSREHLYEIQHRIRNKVGIIKSTLELLHPVETAGSEEEIEDIRRIHRALTDLVKIADDII